MLPDSFLLRPIAHRAYHDIAQGRPENSRAAIRAAVTAGYGIEIDVQPSADGMAMVFHDEWLDRLTGETGPINVRSASELGRIVLKHGEEGIPTLREVLEIIGGKVPLLIEIKDQDGQMGGNIGPLEEATARELKGYAGPVAVMSFNPHSVEAVARLAPDVPRGLTTSAYHYEDWSPVAPAVCDRLREIPDYDRTGACFISHEAHDLARPRVAELKAGGAAVLCWTIRSPEAEATARRIAHNVTFEGYAA
jgi:glycerophosphoryl diester phosphodiesterase